MHFSAAASKSYSFFSAVDKLFNQIKFPEKKYKDQILYFLLNKLQNASVSVGGVKGGGSI